MRVTFPENLPISARVEDISSAIHDHQVVIVAGETGSGKTTQLPKICLAMLEGRQRHEHGYIGCTQPRRIAATSVAARVAEELETQLGDVVGYKVRFNDKISRDSYIKFLTDGMLLAEIQNDPLLRAYSAIIVDEAHERSLNIDFLLGFLQRLIPKRPDLRVIVSSATLETERFSKFFGGAPVIEVSGRTYPVDVLYRPPSEEEADLAEAVANTVNEITEMDPRGDILVFLPGEREIREAAGELEQRALPHTAILPLYARLSAQEQSRVFQRGGTGRRVVLATNVAETSLTIPGIVYVVDPGVARVNRYNVRTGVTQLLVEDVSRASADQRKGRCGRTQNGICFRLYEESDYLARPSHTDPEIRRVGLAGVILRMKSLRLGAIEDFPFLDPPPKRAIDEGYRVLEELGAITEDGHLTEIGEALGELPVDPRLGRMILGGREERALREVVIIAAALGLQDPRERPLAAQQKADEAHRKFKDEGSDFASYLKLWALWQEGASRSKSQRYKLCRESFLNFNRMREWEDIHAQLVRVMREWNFQPNEQPASTEQLHRALLPALLSKIGMWNVEARIFVGAKQTRFQIHPSSGLARKPPQWVMAAELVETSQLFARTVAKLDPTWIEKAALHLCKRSYGNPHWEQKQGQVVASEQVTLYGLPIVKDRKVAYAPFDPKGARELFITHALVRHEYVTKGPFMEHNRRLLDDVARLRDKARQSDMLADDEALWEFFDAKLAADVASGKTFEAWRREAETKDPRVLFLAREDVLRDEEAALSPERYPDRLMVGSAAMALSYRFEPGEEDDGITIAIPLAVLPQLDPDVMAWTIPGWHAKKIEALLDGLPKAARKSLGAPIEEVALAVAGMTKPFDGPMLARVERAVFEHTGERIGRDAWDLRAVPTYLGFTYRVVDEHDKTLGTGRDLGELQRSLAARAKQLWASVPRERHERTGLRGWDFGELPESVTVEVAGKRVLAYPALVETEAAVDLRLLESAAAAAAATRDGLRRLFVIQMGQTMAKLDAQVSGAVAAIATKRIIVQRVVDEAFAMERGIPRTKLEFEKRSAAGRAAYAGVLAELVGVATKLAADVEQVRSLVKPLAGRPGTTRAAVEDIQAQLAHVAPPELLRWASLARLGHVARYLRGIVVRLQRLAHDPNKDATKAAAVAPFWTNYQKRHADLVARRQPITPELVDFGWAVEEFRIATFAPELKTAYPISAQRMTDLWSIASR